jgi:hypothetical protein
VARRAGRHRGGVTRPRVLVDGRQGLDGAVQLGQTFGELGALGPQGLEG